MHDSVMHFVRNNLSREEVEGKRVLEVGSYWLNGSVRPMIEAMKPASYLGIDRQPGPGVDLKWDWTNHFIPQEISRSWLQRWHLVISTEMLEHCKDWRSAVYRMKEALISDGILILTARAPGFQYHDPPDYWRFRIQDVRLMFADMKILRLEPDPQVPGVFIKAQRSGESTIDLSMIPIQNVAGFVCSD